MFVFIDYIAMMLMRKKRFEDMSSIGVWLKLLGPDKKFGMSSGNGNNTQPYSGKCGLRRVKG